MDRRLTVPGSARRDAVVALVGAVIACAVVAAAAVAPGGGLEAALAGGVGVGLVGIACAALVRRPDGWSGPADRVTLTRTVLGGGVATAVLVDLLSGSLGPSWQVVALAAPTLALDAVDGAVARRTGTANDAGARFDMEVDAALVLVLCLPASAVVGPWVLAAGLMRYAWVALGALRPTLRGSLAPSLARKTVAASLGVALLVVAVPGVPQPVAVTVAAAALGALVWSFGRDGVALERAAARRP